MKNFLFNKTDDPMVTLCRMTREMNYDDLPDDVLQYSKYLILDTVANMIGGSAMEAIPDVVKIVKDKGGKEESMIPFYGGKVPASEAGMAMGPMSRAIDFAPIHPVAMHNSEHVLPAILAALGLLDKVNGKDFLTAFVLGQEVLIRIGIAFNPLKAVASGRSNGHYIFGSVSGVGRLLNLSQVELENAQGIARSMTQPHDMAAFHPITQMVKVHQGFIAQDAINCCVFAKNGIQGPRHDILLEPMGYLGFAKWETFPEALTDAIGEKWHSLEIEFKPFPGCKSHHTAINCVNAPMEEHGFEKDDIERIEFEMPPVSYSLVCHPMEEKMQAKSEYECQFSLPYVIATYLHDGDIMPKSFEAEARGRQSVRNYMHKISAKKNPDLPSWGSKARVVLNDGREFSSEFHAEHIKGSPKNPLSKEEHVEKFRKCVPYCAFKLGDKEVDSIIDAILNLELIANVEDAILKPLTP